jgi:hypothetical protein
MPIEYKNRSGKKYYLQVIEQKREFQARRYCYLGRLSRHRRPCPLVKLAKLYIKHLGLESYYEPF